MNKILEKSAKAAGIKMFNVDFVGFNLSKKNGKQYINSFPFDDEGQVIFPNRKDLNKKISDDYQPPIEINLDDTLIMPRGLGTPGLTNSRYWTDTIKKLANCTFSNKKLVGGECATPGIISLIASCNNSKLKDKLNLNKDSQVLLLGCEGDVDEELYNKLLNI